MMTHKQKAIEALNKLHGLIDVVADAMTPDEYRTMYDTLADLREHVTLMEPVGNPALIDANMGRPLSEGERQKLVNWLRGLSGMEPVENPAAGETIGRFPTPTEMARAQSPVRDGRYHERAADAYRLHAPAPITARCNPIRMDAEEEPVLECSRCVRTAVMTRKPFQYHVTAVDRDGHKECPECGDRNNLRVRR